MSVNTSGGCGWIGSALRWISRRFVKCKMGFSTTKKGKNFGRVQMDVMMVEFKEVGKICKSWPARGRCEIWGTLVMRLKRIKLKKFIPCSAKSKTLYLPLWKATLARPLLLLLCGCYDSSLLLWICYSCADISPLGLLQMFTPYVAAKHWQESRDYWRLSKLIRHMQSTDGFWTVITCVS